MKYENFAVTVEKLLTTLKYKTDLQNDRQDKNNMPPDFRSQGHKNQLTALPKVSRERF